MKAILADQQVVGKQGQVIGFDEKGRQQAAEVGGVNLLPGTGNNMKIVLQTTTNGYDIATWASYTALEPQIADDAPIPTCNKYVRLTLEGGQTKYNHRLMLEKIPLARMGKFTISCWARSENNSPLLISCQPSPYTNWALTKTHQILDATWKRYAFSFDMADAKEDGLYSVQVGIPGASKETDQIVDVLLAIQLERGSVATDWSPAPEDLAYKSELAIKSNPNLLDNWYFANPINQRGQTEYTAAGYTIDRWRTNVKNTVVTVNQNDRCISIKCPTEGAGLGAGIYQKIEYIAEKDQEVTFSVIFKGDIYICHWAGVFTYKSSTDWDVITMTYTVPAGYNMTTGYMPYMGCEPDKSASVFAAKLEFGDHQTLAHQDSDGNWVLNDYPPDYGTELAKCQQYYQIFATESKRAVEAEDFRPVMRIKPVLSQISIGERMYYTADANL